MEGKTHLVCVICCGKFRNKADLKENSVKCLQQFCEEVLVEGGGEEGRKLRERFGFLWGDGSGLINKWNGKRKKTGKVTGEDFGEEGNREKFGGSLEEKLAKFLDNPDDNLGICGKCLGMMESVSEARLLVKPVEERVEKLQMLLLREMRRLNRKMEGVWREFGKMEEMRNGGDRRFMENCLDESYLRKGKGKKGKQKVFGRINDEHWERKEEIWGLRAKISEVWSDLDKYHEATREKFGKSSGKVREALERKVEECVVVKEEPMEDQNNLEDNQDNFYEDQDNLSASLGDDGDNEDDDDLVEGNEEPMDLDEFINNLCENEEEDDGNQSSEEMDNGGDYKESLSDEDKEEEEEDDPSDDDDYTPISRTIRYDSLLSDFEWHLSKLSVFKRGIVESVLKCQQRHLSKKLENKNKPRSKILEAESLLTPYQRYMAKLTYHSESETIYLTDIPIKLFEDEINGNGMLCTKCNFKSVAVESADIEVEMYDHVLSKHLNAYHCPHCGDDNQLETDKDYRKHVKICRESCSCDICGKPFTTGRGLKDHKWSHMNEEERKEAVEKGETKPPRNLNLKELPRKHQCQKCGKSFKFLGDLKRHEIVHEDRSNREQFVCPKCGKSFLKEGIAYHLKWSDSCAEGEQVVKRVECLQCGKSFKNKTGLRNHVNLVHEEKGKEKPFVCEVCGKGFRVRGLLIDHGSVHTGEKRWRCGGCGAEFGRYSSLKRHEKSCGK